MKKNLRLLLRALAFLLVLGIAVGYLQTIFGLNVIRSYEHEKAYLWEDNNSMDAVYIGGSDVHAFWRRSSAGMTTELPSGTIPSTICRWRP